MNVSTARCATPSRKGVDLASSPLLSLARMCRGAPTTIAALALALLPAVARADVCPSILAGSCWTLGEATLGAVSSASQAGKSVRCTLRCRTLSSGVLILRDDGTYSSPASTATATCPSGEVAIPDEEGVVRQKRGKLLLEPSNLDEFGAALDACVGRDVSIRRYRTTVRIADDGLSLSGVTKLRLLTPGRAPITTRVTARFTATRAETVRPAAAASPSPRARELPACSIDLEPRCVTD